MSNLNHRIVKHHLRIMVEDLGGIAAASSKTGIPRGTLGHYHNFEDKTPVPIGVMTTMMSASGIYSFIEVMKSTSGYRDDAALVNWRSANAQSYLNGDHDADFDGESQ